MTPNFPPRGIPTVIEPNAPYQEEDNVTMTSSITGQDPDDDIDLRPQIVPATRHEYLGEYENEAYEIEPEYTSDLGSDEPVSGSDNPSDSPSYNSNIDTTRRPVDEPITSYDAATDTNEQPMNIAVTPDQTSLEPIDEAVTSSENATDTEAIAPSSNQESADKEKQIAEETSFIDNLIDSAKGKVDDCVIA